MATTNKTPQWTQDDATNLRVFLGSDTGVRTLAWLKYWAPHLLDGSHVNRTLVASGQVKGYSAVLENLDSLTKENPSDQPVPTEYPDIDDDTKWTEEQNNRDIPK
jgi:hypothetical protein